MQDYFEIIKLLLMFIHFFITGMLYPIYVFWSNLSFVPSIISIIPFLIVFYKVLNKRLRRLA